LAVEKHESLSEEFVNKNVDNDEYANWEDTEEQKHILHAHDYLLF
jgi:hypothetical protein